MNKLSKLALMMLGGSALGAITLPAQAQGRYDPREEELACERALEQNTLQALERYLRDYPRGSSACRALAFNAISGLDGGKERGGGPGTRNNGYNR